MRFGCQKLLCRWKVGLSRFFTRKTNATMAQEVMTLSSYGSRHCADKFYQLVMLIARGGADSLCSIQVAQNAFSCKEDC